LQSAYGGYAPGYGGDFTAGNGTLWEFTESTYLRYNKGNFYDSGTHMLTRALTLKHHRKWM